MWRPSDRVRAAGMGVGNHFLKAAGAAGVRSRRRGKTRIPGFRERGVGHPRGAGSVQVGMGERAQKEGAVSKW